MPRPTPRREPSSRNVYIFGLTSFLNDTATEMAYWVLPAFLASLGAGPAQLGLIEGIAESVASFAKLFSGFLSDHIRRRKPVVVSGYLVANAVKPLLALATSWLQILGIRFADRLAKGVRGAPRDVMVAETVPRERLGSAYGLIQAMDSAGAIVGPLTALILLSPFGLAHFRLSHLGLRGVFWATAVPGALSVLVVAFGVHEKTRATASIAKSKVAGRKDDAGFKSPGRASLPVTFYFVLVAVSLFSVGNSSDMFLVLRAQNVGISVSLAPLLGLVFNITFTLASWPAGRLSDRVSRRMLAAAGYLVFAAVYSVFGRAPSRSAIWAAMTVYGLYYALTQPVLKALVVESVDAEIRGRALGVYFFVTSVATLAASLITGELWKHYGAGVPFYFSAGMAVLAAGMLMLSKSSRSLADVQ